MYALLRDFVLFLNVLKKIANISKIALANLIKFNSINHLTVDLSR